MKGKFVASTPLASLSLVWKIRMMLEKVRKDAVMISSGNRRGRAERTMNTPRIRPMVPARLIQNT